MMICTEQKQEGILSRTDIGLHIYRKYK
jgi:hypothetical protein